MHNYYDINQNIYDNINGKYIFIFHKIGRKFANEFAFDIDKRNKIKFLFVN